VKKLAAKERDALLATLKARFDANPARHRDLQWSKVQAALEKKPGKLAALAEMERTGGEPDVVGYDRNTKEFIFYDCVAESPAGRRSVCYDREALEARKKHKPKHSAVGMATEMGADLLTVEEYHGLQKLGEFDTRTSSWLATPPEIRERGGAIFGDFRYGTVFVYHNGADSYYAARGFRCSLRV